MRNVFMISGNAYPLFMGGGIQIYRGV